MEKMIQDYREAYNALKERTKFLRECLKTETLEPKERDKIKGRIELMYEERAEITHVIDELKKHL